MIFNLLLKYDSEKISLTISITFCIILKLEKNLYTFFIYNIATIITHLMQYYLNFISNLLNNL